jgi:HEAT repeats/Putative zinc-finger
MTCHDAQSKLSLYLYGELEFTEEEEFEQHVSECAVCDRALLLEKAWHSSVNAERTDVPLELLAACRNELSAAITSIGAGRRAAGWRDWIGVFRFSGPQWSKQLAAASFLVFVGFSAGRYIERNGLPGVGVKTEDMGVINPSSARIRGIEPEKNNRVRVVFDQEREVTGPVDSDTMRRLLLLATTDEADPGIRMDSVSVLNGQAGTDVRDALLSSIQHDPNAAVRLKAVQALAGFRDDDLVRDGLVYVLQHDENAGVRSQAIDVLAPANAGSKISPDLADALQDVVRSSQPDDYVRLRCLELLRDANSPFAVY